jgi:hypothetical protein
MPPTVEEAGDQRWRYDDWIAVETTRLHPLAAGRTYRTPDSIFPEIMLRIPNASAIACSLTCDSLCTDRSHNSRIVVPNGLVGDMAWW